MEVTVSTKGSSVRRVGKDMGIDTTKSVRGGRHRRSTARRGSRVMTGLVVASAVALAGSPVAGADPISDARNLLQRAGEDLRSLSPQAADELEKLLGGSGVVSILPSEVEGVSDVTLDTAALRDLLGNGTDVGADAPEAMSFEVPEGLAAEAFNFKELDLAEGDLEDQISDRITELLENQEILDQLLGLLGLNQDGGGETPPTGGSENPIEDIDIGAITDGLGPIINSIIDIVDKVMNGEEITSEDFQGLFNEIRDLLTGAGVDLVDGDGGGDNGDDEDPDEEDEYAYLDWNMTFIGENDVEETMTVREFLDTIGVEYEDRPDEDNGGSGDGDDNDGDDNDGDDNTGDDNDGDDNGSDNTDDDSEDEDDNTGGQNNSGGSGSDGDNNVDTNSGEGSGGSDDGDQVAQDNNGNTDGDGALEKAVNDGGQGGGGSTDEAPVAQNTNNDVPPPTHNTAAEDSLPVTGASSTTAVLAGLAVLALLVGSGLVVGSRWRGSRQM